MRQCGFCRLALGVLQGFTLKLRIPRTVGAENVLWPRFVRVSQPVRDLAEAHALDNLTLCVVYQSNRSAVVVCVFRQYLSLGMWGQSCGEFMRSS